MKTLSLFLLLITCVASGCKALKASPEPAGAAPGSNPRTEVIEASHKLIEAKSLTGRIDATGPAPFKQQVEYVAPDRYRVSYRDEAGAETQLLMAGDKSYVRSGDSWNEMSSDTNPTPTIRNSFSDEVLGSISEAKFEGEDKVDGKTALVYSYKLVTKVGNFPVTQKIWVDTITGIPIKCYVEYSEGSIKTLTTTFDTELPVTIDLPSN